MTSWSRIANARPDGKLITLDEWFHQKPSGEYYEVGQLSTATHMTNEQIRVTTNRDEIPEIFTHVMIYKRY